MSPRNRKLGRFLRIIVHIHQIDPNVVSVAEVLSGNLLSAEQIGVGLVQKAQRNPAVTLGAQYIASQHFANSLLEGADDHFPLCFTDAAEDDTAGGSGNPIELSFVNQVLHLITDLCFWIDFLNFIQ